MQNISVNLSDSPHQYEISVGSQVLKNTGVWIKNAKKGEPTKVAIVSNVKVFDLYGDVVKSSLEKCGIGVCVFLMGDGEEYKNLETLESVLNFLSGEKISRTDCLIALGGGVVGDLAGFASAIYLRGISFFQIPTTLLAMIDSSVGGKTAVNSKFGKNLVGAFHQPNGVLIDIETLQTLETREITAGFCEAIKQAAISSEDLFYQTSKFLKNYPVKELDSHFQNDHFKIDLEKLLAAQISFKAEIVMQDELEEPTRTDAKSRKILNFGHTFGHALEKVTNYKYFKHGEAVGYGILFAAELSKTLEIFDENRLNLLYDVVHRAGILPKLDNVNKNEVLEAFAFDKKIINESLQWILLEDFGKPCIRKNITIPVKAFEKVLEKFLEN